MRMALRLLSFMAFVAIGLPVWAARPVIEFGCAVDQSLPLFKKAEAIYRKAFDHLGYDFKMVNYETHRRSLAESESGHIDGDCGRVAYLSSEVMETHLLKVDVLILSTELSVWSFTDKLAVSKIEQINSKGLTLGYVRGVLVQEKIVKDNKIDRVVTANSYEQAVKMLAAERFDVFITSTDMIQFEIKHLDLDKKLYKIGVLGSFQLYPYLNEKHRNLVSPLEVELKKIVPAGGI